MSKFLQVGIQAVKKAEKIILKYYQQELKIKTKPDLSPVTIADHEAEKIIIDIIKKSFPDHGFIGEEFGIQKQNSPYQWTIDPIDGTKNFIRGIPYFSTLLALMKNNEIILGIFNAPVRKKLIYAQKGSGAYLGNQRIRVSQTKQISRAWVCHGGINHFAKCNLADNLIHLAQRSSRVRGLGDSLMYEVLAQGKYDIVAEAYIHLWDIAPFKIIIKEAGGKMTDIFGKPINQNTTTVLASNGLLHQQALKFFKKY